MNPDELKRALDEATEGLAPPQFDIEHLASAGRRRRRQNLTLAGVAACVVLVAGILGVVNLASGEDRGQVVKTAEVPKTSTTHTSPPTSSTPSSPTTTPTTATPSTTTETSVSTTTSTTTTVTSPPTTPSTTTTTTTEPDPIVRPVSRPAAQGDIDGDGNPDAIELEPSGQDELVVRASLTTLGVQSVTVERNGDRFLTVMGITDVDRDGYGEVFLRVGSGVSTVQGTILRLVDDRLVALTRSYDVDVPGPTFSVHGSVTHLESLSCLAGSSPVQLTMSLPLDPDAATFEVIYETYRFDGAQLALVERRTETVPASQVPDGVIGCEGVPGVW